MAERNEHEEQIQLIADYAQDLAVALSEPFGVIRKQLDVITKYFEADHFFLLRIHKLFNTVFTISSDIDDFDPSDIINHQDRFFTNKNTLHTVENVEKFGSVEGNYVCSSILVPMKSSPARTYLVFLSKENKSHNTHFLQIGVHGLATSLDKEEYDIEYLLKRAKSLPKDTVDRLSSLTFSVDKLDLDTMFMSLVGFFVHDNLLTDLGVNEIVFVSFLIKLKSLYRDVPYHNWRHAADATQFVFYFLQSRDMTKYITKMECFATLLSAICHDVEHNGYTNDFHRKTNSLFNQISGPNMPPLELHHADRSLCLIQSEYKGIIENFSTEDYEDFVSKVFGIILATDMSKHKQYIEDFIAIKDSYDKSNSQHRLLLCQIIMKSADLSNTIREFTEASVMAQKLVDEWFRQGDAERARGLQVTKGYDRASPGRLCDGQIGFYKFVSFPLVKAVADWFGDYQEAVAQYESNLKTWESIASQ